MKKEIEKDIEKDISYIESGNIRDMNEKDGLLFLDNLLEKLKWYTHGKQDRKTYKSTRKNKAKRNK